MLPSNTVVIVYTTDFREDPDRGTASTGPDAGDGCDHERTVYVQTADGSAGSLTCQDCGSTMPVEADAWDGRPTAEGGLSAPCRWVLTRVGGRY